MVTALVKKIFGTKNSRELKRMGRIVERINALEDETKALADADFPERTRALKQRVLTIHGTRDRNAPYGSGREWAGSLLSNARLVKIEGGAHQCFAEYPDRVFPAIETFLAGGWPKNAEQLAR